jgi:hypothetical protein
MASGLCLLGRGGRRSSVYALTHVVCAAIGGAALGLILGEIGRLLPATPQALVAAGGIVWAAYLAVRPPVTGAGGLRRQLARRLEGRLHPSLAYAVWGAELGSGLSTLIPYSAFLLLLVIEMVSGPFVGAVAGAAFGVARQGAAAAIARSIDSPAPIMALLPRLAHGVRVANLAACLVGGIALASAMIR